MRLEKRQQRELIILAIIFVVYNVLAFVLPFNMTNVFWVAYVFDLIAILLQFPILCVAFKSGKDVKSKFYGFPIARVGVTYLCVQLAASFVIMALSAWAPVQLAVALFILILALAAIGLIAADATRDEIERQDIQLKKDVTTMRTLQSKANALVGRCEDAELHAKLQRFAENLRFSDPVSSKALEETEAELSQYVKELECAVIDADISGALGLCNKAENLLKERNRLCKLMKAY